MTVLVDSDVLIEVTRARDAATLKKWADLAESTDVVLCTPVSVSELWHGARPSEHRCCAIYLTPWCACRSTPQPVRKRANTSALIIKVMASNWATHDRRCRRTTQCGPLDAESQTLSYENPRVLLKTPRSGR